MLTKWSTASSAGTAADRRRPAPAAPRTASRRRPRTRSRPRLTAVGVDRVGDHFALADTGDIGEELEFVAEERVTSGEGVPLLRGSRRVDVPGMDGGCGGFAKTDA